MTDNTWLVDTWMQSAIVYFWHCSVWLSIPTCPTSALAQTGREFNNFYSLCVLKFLLNPFPLLVCSNNILRTHRIKSIISIPTQNHRVNHQNGDGSVTLGNLEVQLIVEVRVDPVGHYQNNPQSSIKSSDLNYLWNLSPWM